MIIDYALKDIRVALLIINNITICNIPIICLTRPTIIALKVIRFFKYDFYTAARYFCFSNFCAAATESMRILRQEKGIKRIRIYTIPSFPLSLRGTLLSETDNIVRDICDTAKTGKK